MIDHPAGKWAEGRRSHRFPGSKVETSMMPGTANLAIGYDPVCQWAVIVSTFRSNCEVVVAAPDEQHGIFADMTSQFLSVGELASRNA
jgi:hypothetical protein